MGKKPRLSEEAFDWVKDTSAQGEGESASEEETPREQAPGADPAAASLSSEAKRTPPKQTSRTKKTAPAHEASGRSVYVKYRPDDGTIVSMVEVTSESYAADQHPFVRVRDGEDVFLYTLPKRLADKSLAVIHNTCRVKTTGKESSLVLKK